MEGRSGDVKKIVIATKNQGKIREMIHAFAGLDVRLVSLAEFGSLPDAAEDGKTFGENARSKAEFYREQTGCACLADDSGLCIDVLAGAPGVYSARFAGHHAGDGENNAKLVTELARHHCDASPAAYHCVLAFADTDGTLLTAEGICPGTVRSQAQGTGGFGYDPYFYVGEKTMAELTLEEKDKISHRGAALRQMAKKLEEYLK